MSMKKGGRYLLIHFKYVRQCKVEDILYSIQMDC